VYEQDVAGKSRLAAKRGETESPRMPRPPRDFAPGVHHIGAGASGPSQYFRDDVDHASWLRLFAKVLDRQGWTCIVVCHLSTHWHAIVEVRDHSLPDGMQYLNGEYARAFNERHGRVGYLIRDRYWSRRKSDDLELLNAYCYAVNNPVAARIVVRAEDWPWSSYATTLGLADSFLFVDAGIVLRQFGPDPAAAAVALRRYVSGLSGSRAGQ
jgi:REP-associated tyrosine transposase